MHNRRIVYVHLQRILIRCDSTVCTEHTGLVLTGPCESPALHETEISIYDLFKNSS
jgi:hypothetical protein